MYYLLIQYSSSVGIDHITTMFFIHTLTLPSICLFFQYLSGARSKYSSNVFLYSLIIILSIHLLVHSLYSISIIHLSTSQQNTYFALLVATQPAAESLRQREPVLKLIWKTYFSWHLTTGRMLWQ